jgi:hypothetical protein
MYFFRPNLLAGLYSVKPVAVILKIGQLEGNGLNEVLAMAARVTSFGMACANTTSA